MGGVEVVGLTGYGLCVEVTGACVGLTGYGLGMWDV